MKKFFYIIIAIIIIFIIAIGIMILNKRAILQTVLSKELGVKVKIEKVLLSTKNFSMLGLHIFNPKSFSEPKALDCKKFSMDYTLEELTGKRLTINDITIDDIDLNVIMTGKGSDNNWSQITAQNQPKEKPSKSSEKDEKQYLIRKMTINNLSLALIDANGKIRKFPTLSQLTFTNISNESGFPISDIESAIINQIIKDALLKHGLNTILDTIKNPTAPIEKLLPFDIFNSSKAPTN
jgi:hypothetical protein